MRVLAHVCRRSRCGCSLSDASGTIVTPIYAVPRPGSKRGLQALAQIAREREVERVLVGLPLSLRGSDTAQTRETRAFARQLEQALGPSLPVEMHDDRFTTRLASRVPGSF